MSTKRQIEVPTWLIPFLKVTATYLYMLVHILHKMYPASGCKTNDSILSLFVFTGQEHRRPVWDRLNVNSYEEWRVNVPHLETAHQVRCVVVLSVTSGHVYPGLINPVGNEDYDILGNVCFLEEVIFISAQGMRMFPWFTTEICIYNYCLFLSFAGLENHGWI